MAKLNNTKNYESNYVMKDDYVPEKEPIEVNKVQIFTVILSIMVIIIGALATVSLFVGWETFKNYYIAGTGFLALISGFILLILAAFDLI